MFQYCEVSEATELDSTVIWLGVLGVWLSAPGSGMAPLGSTCLFWLKYQWKECMALMPAEMSRTTVGIPEN